MIKEYKRLYSLYGVVKIIKSTHLVKIMDFKLKK